MIDFITENSATGAVADKTTPDPNAQVVFGTDGEEEDEAEEDQ